ncbi:putative WD repeat-containing protein C13G6.08 [Colletotrichum chlorophyti]|uniref:Putative WD repeat-containing protein C13G6.08 n=1 Tax=Colletotrichum chlorophyti TaxID=708187 RepID=A0A1Q8RPB1_9PEZI|nr:putative WD repeat-containing protein C13G6.08 [Colletotrichum chlorophyti]
MASYLQHRQGQRERIQQPPRVLAIARLLSHQASEVGICTGVPRQSARPDPFRTPPRLTAPIASDFRSVSGSSAGSTSVLSVAPSNRSSVGLAGSGTAWTPRMTTPPTSAAVNGGRGRYLRTGTNVQLFTANFSSSRLKQKEDIEQHQGRLAEALKIDQVARILDFGRPSSPHERVARLETREPLHLLRTNWNGSEWVTHSKNATVHPSADRKLPVAPYRVLDAPGLRDDYYSSVLAYSPTCQSLAVGLDGTVYKWSESTGPRTVYNAPWRRHSWVTSISLSSAQGGKAILAVGRKDGVFALMSFSNESFPRFEMKQQGSVDCVSWRPTVTMRPSKNPCNPDIPVPTEDLLVGDDKGTIHYYVVEWPSIWEVSRDNWHGRVTHVASIAAHTQQICALVWSPDGRDFVSGSNDNAACYFEVGKMMKSRLKHWDSSTATARTNRWPSNDGSLPEVGQAEHRTRNPREPSDSLESLINTVLGNETVEIGVDGILRRAVQSPAEDTRHFGRGEEKWC